MELLGILSSLIVIGVVVYLVASKFFHVASTGRAVKSWEKRFAEQEAEAERERGNVELWEAIGSNTPLSDAPCPALCDDCKEDGGKSRWMILGEMFSTAIPFQCSYIRRSKLRVAIVYYAGRQCMNWKMSS